MSMRQICEDDRPAIARFIAEHWGSTQVVCGGRSYYPHEHDGALAQRAGRIVGLVTWAHEDATLQVLTLNSLLEGQGIGTALMSLAAAEARRTGDRKVWLITTNDNTQALRFYQRRGFRMTAVRVGAVDAARQIKPQIPDLGNDGIPMHDEIVLELELPPAQRTE